MSLKALETITDLNNDELLIVKHNDIPRSVSYMVEKTAKNVQENINNTFPQPAEEIDKTLAEKFADWNFLDLNDKKLKLCSINDKEYLTLLKKSTTDSIFKSCIQQRIDELNIQQ